MADSTSNPIEPNQQQDFQRFEDTLIKIYKAAKIKEGAVLTVQDGLKNVYKGIPGQTPIPTNAATDSIQKVISALEDPQEIKGTVKLLINNKPVLIVSNGKVLKDNYHLTSSQKTTQQINQPNRQQSKRLYPEDAIRFYDADSQLDSPQQEQQPKRQADGQEASQQTKETEQTAESQSSPSQQSQSQPAQAATPNLQDQVAMLRATIEQQQKQLETLNQKLDQIASSPVLVVVANEKLNNWLSNIRSKVQAAGSEAVVQVSNKLEQNKASLFSKVQQLFANAKENVTDTIHATRDRVNAKASEVVLGAMTAATAKLASTIGEKMPDGSVVVESRSRNQQLEVNGNSVAIKERPQLDAQALWDKYSHDVPQDSPPRRTQMVAQNAIRDGITKTAVEDMLKVDPQFQKVQQQQGLGKAQDYAKQMTRSAIRREQPVKQQEQQQRNRNQSQNNGLQR